MSSEDDTLKRLEQRARAGRQSQQDAAHKLNVNHGIVTNPYSTGEERSAARSRLEGMIGKPSTDKMLETQAERDARMVREGYRVRKGKDEYGDTLTHYEKKACFVATVVYGSQDASQVQALREFRDMCLVRNAVGRALIRAYYGGVGVGLAGYVKRHAAFALPPVRSVLDRLVRWWKRKGHARFSDSGNQL